MSRLFVPTRGTASRNPAGIGSWSMVADIMPPYLLRSGHSAGMVLGAQAIGDHAVIIRQNTTCGIAGFDARAGTDLVVSGTVPARTIVGGGPVRRNRMREDDRP